MRETGQTAASNRLRRADGCPWSVLDAFTDPVCILDSAGLILAVNRSWQDLAGQNPPLTANAGVGANYFAECREASLRRSFPASEAIEGLQAVARGELPEFVLGYSIDSPEMPGRWEMRAALLESGAGAALILTHRNLTGRRQSEERMRAIADYTYDWESWIGTDGRPRWINPAVERITGVSVADCMGMDDYPLPLVHPDDRDRMRVHFAAALTGVSGNDVPFRISRPDDTEAWGSVSWQPITATDGAALGYRTSVRDITARKKSEAALRQLNAQLEDRVAARTAELTAALARLAVVEVRERHRISLELHDQTAQRLVALAIELKTLQENHAAGRSLDERLQAMRTMVDDLQQQVRQIAWNLRAGEKMEGGLARALREYIEDWSERAHVPVDYECRGLRGKRLPALIETTLYRVAQEALANIEKHARARRVSVLLERDEALARLTVEDDGCGFDADTLPQLPDTSPHLGLLGMRERVALAGGTFLIESAPGAGATILVRIPMPSPTGRP